MLAAGSGMRATHQFVRRQLNQMLPLAFAVAEDLDEMRIVFVGDSKSIQYVASMPGYLGSGGPQVQFMELANGDDGSVLQFRHALLQGYEEARLFDRDPVVLLENVESADFEYLGLDEEGELTPWISSWDQPEKLPVAVRLNVEFADDVRMLWPELVAGVRLDESAVQGGAGRQSYEQTIRGLMKGKDKGGTRK